MFTCLEAAWAQVEYLPVNTAKGGIRRCANPEAAKKWLAQRGIKWEAPAQKSQVKPAAKPAKKNATKQPTKKATPETKQKKKSKQKVSTKSVVAGKKGKTHKTSPFAVVGEKDVAMVYTDGSFNDGTMIWGYSALIYDARDKKAQLVFSGSGVEYSDKKNITGEIMGAYRGIQEALKLGYKNIVVCHDFDGVAGYAKGSYSNGNELASWYHSEVGNLMAQAQISFKKIAAHSGNEYNTKADRCARIAAGVQV